MLALICVLLMCAGTFSSHSPALRELQGTCKDVLTAVEGGEGIAMAGHYLHSMTVETLRQYFDPEATEQNFVPTVNVDVKSENPLLDYAPSIKTDDDGIDFTFKYQAMEDVNYVMTHLATSGWNAKANPFHLIIHTFHMRDALLRAKEHFDRLEQTPLPQQTCDCALDYKHNGYYDVQKSVALLIREPEIMFGINKTSNREAPGIIYKFTKYQSLTESEDSLPPITDKQSWLQWKRQFAGDHIESGAISTAVYLHCAVRKATAMRTNQ